MLPEYKILHWMLFDTKIISRFTFFYENFIETLKLGSEQILNIFRFLRIYKQKLEYIWLSKYLQIKI